MGPTEKASNEAARKVLPILREWFAAKRGESFFITPDEPELVKLLGSVDEVVATLLWIANNNVGHVVRIPSLTFHLDPEDGDLLRSDDLLDLFPVDEKKTPVMSDWTYEPPEPAIFVRNLTRIVARRNKDVAPHLARARAAFEVSSTYGNRPHAYTVSIRLSVPDDALDHLEAPIAKMYLREAAQLAIPAEAGLDVVEVEVVPFLDEAGAPHDDRLGEVLRADYAGVKDAWAKALLRREDDPDGALTAARTLVETLLKHMLEDFGGTYESGDDLPKLYKAVAKKLNLAPEQHTEETFKRILGGCTSVVEGLGSVRSKVGDAHGHGRRTWKVEPRHAELAVNLAGAMATFLVLTKEARDSAGKAAR